MQTRVQHAFACTACEAIYWQGCDTCNAKTRADGPYGGGGQLGKVLAGQRSARNDPAEGPNSTIKPLLSRPNLDASSFYITS